MDRYVLIFAKTKHEKTPYDQWLKDTKITPIILTSKDFLPGYEHLPYVCSFENYDYNRLVEKVAFEICQTFNIVAIFARAEADIMRAAHLREYFRIPGQNIESALAYRNKVIMKNHLLHSRVILPEFSLIDSAVSILDFIHKHDYPVVIKPCMESGSFGTVIIKCEDDLNDFLAAGIKGELEIEKFIPGEMYHIDGLMIDGEIRFIHPFKYVNDCLSFRNDDFVGSYSLSFEDEHYLPLMQSALEVVYTLPSPEHMAFHCELWVTPSKEIVFCEIASRTGGGMISSMINQGMKLNLDYEWFRAEIGHSTEEIQVKFAACGSINIPPQKGILVELPESVPSFVKETQITGQLGQEYSGGVKSGLFLAGYVVDGATQKDIFNNILAVGDWFKQSTKWEMRTV
jgi:biotin carboxylase